MNYTQFIFIRLFLEYFPSEKHGNVHYDIADDELFEIVNIYFEIYKNQVDDNSITEYDAIRDFFNKNQNEIYENILKKHNEWI